MSKERVVQWDKVDQSISSLETDVSHRIMVQREAIPLVFVPGIMGSRLRRTGTKQDPDVRWDPGKQKWMLDNYYCRGPAYRKRMLVGDKFSSNYLEVDDNGIFGQGYDGFHGIMEDYCGFLNVLRAHDWGHLTKIFEFPVYAVGYNWTDDATKSGQVLKARIEAIIKEAAEITGFCRKVILITHSMGGLVARSASELAGAQASILGIIHGVQPAAGAPAAYWRIKAGFEASSLLDKAMSNCVGFDGPTVTVILGNIPGGLQLLPTKSYPAKWLTIVQDDEVVLQLPKTDPYKEIYEVPAVVRLQLKSGNKYWGLVDPELLDPGAIRGGGNLSDVTADALVIAEAWSEYLKQLKKAQTFHDTLKLQGHPRMFFSWGSMYLTAENILFEVESNWKIGREPYETRGFRGLFKDDENNSMQAVLQKPSGVGDGTVPTSSATALKSVGKKSFPGDRAFYVKHQEAYADTDVQQYTIKAIVALCRMHYKDCRGG